VAAKEGQLAAATSSAKELMAGLEAQKVERLKLEQSLQVCTCVCVRLCICVCM